MCVCIDFIYPNGTHTHFRTLASGLNQCFQTRDLRTYFIGPPILSFYYVILQICFIFRYTVSTVLCETRPKMFIRFLQSIPLVKIYSRRFFNIKAHSFIRFFSFYPRYALCRHNTVIPLFS